MEPSAEPAHSARSDGEKRLTGQDEARWPRRGTQAEKAHRGLEVTPKSAPHKRPHHAEKRHTGRREAQF